MKKLLLLILLTFIAISCNKKSLAQDLNTKKEIQKTTVTKTTNNNNKDIKVDLKIASKQKAEKQNTKTFMWKVENGKSNMYLLGSIHVAKPSLYPLNSKITNAYKNSKNLVVEVDVQKDQISLQMKTMQVGMFKNKTLKDVLPSSLYAEFSKRATEIGLPMLAINKMKPWLASLSLTIFQMKKLGYDPQSGIDLHFLTLAKKDNKNILELETGEFQLDLLAGFSKELNILNIKLMLKDWDKYQGLLDKMFNEWKIGKTKTLTNLSYKYANKYPELKIYYKKLLIDRNINMAKKLDKMLKTDKNSYFVVVGGGHLIGKEGIIELLRKKGYKISQQ